MYSLYLLLLIFVPFCIGCGQTQVNILYFTKDICLEALDNITYAEYNCKMVENCTSGAIVFLVNEICLIGNPGELASLSISQLGRLTVGFGAENYCNFSYNSTNTWNTNKFNDCSGSRTWQVNQYGGSACGEFMLNYTYDMVTISVF